MSAVAIFNSALDLIGAEVIVAFSDDTKEAKLGLRNYPIVRDDCLIKHYWNFAMRRVELARLPTAPLFGFSYTYQLPADCLRVRETDTNSLKFKVEGRTLVTDSEKVFIDYISQVTDTSQYSPSFKEALSHKIAAKLMYPLTKSRTAARDMHELAKTMIKDAWSVDGQEGDMDQVQEDVWLGSRRHGISGIGPNKVVT